MVQYKSLSNCSSCCCCASILLLINVTTHFGPMGPQSASTSPSAANGVADGSSRQRRSGGRGAGGDTFVACCFLRLPTRDQRQRKNTKTADILNLATGKKVQNKRFLVCCCFWFYFGWGSSFSFIRASTQIA